MRKLTLALLLSAAALGAQPALADGGYNGHGGRDRDSWQQKQQQHQPRADRDYDGRPDRLEDRAYDRRFDRDRDGRPDHLENRAYDQFQPYSHRLYSGWYPGWQNKWWDERHILPPHRLIRRLERQGFYNVRLFGFSHRGMIRAQGFNERGYFVRLQVDPYSGRVIRVMPA